MIDNKLLSVEELKKSFEHLNLILSVEEFLLKEMLFKLDEINLQKLASNEEVYLPITDPLTISRLKSIDSADDMTTLYMCLSELCSDAGLSVDVTASELASDDESVVYSTTYSLHIFHYDATVILDDDDDDGGGDDSDPVAELEEKINVMAMAARA